MAVDSIFGVDIDAIYALGNMWIGLGDALEDHKNAMGNAVAGMNWSGMAGSSMRWLWGSGSYPGGGNGSPEGITKILTDARDNAYQIGGAINNYADQVVAAEAKKKKDDLIELIVALVGIILTFVLPFGVVGEALAAVDQVVGKLVGVLTQLSKLGTIGETISGITGSAITGAAISTIIEFGTEGIVHAAFGEGWKPDPTSAGIVVGGGALYGAAFHTGKDDGATPNGIGDGPKGAPNVGVPKSTPHVDPAMINGKNGAGATPPPKLDSNKFSTSTETIANGGFKPETDLSRTNVTKSSNDSFTANGGAKDGVTNPSNISANNDAFIANGGRNGSGRPNGTQSSGNEGFTGGGNRPGGPSGPDPVRSSNDPVSGNGDNARNGSDPATVTSGTNSFVAGGGRNGSGRPNGPQPSRDEGFVAGGNRPGGPSGTDPAKAFSSSAKPGQTPADFTARPGGNNERVVADPGSVERGSQSASNGRGTSGAGPNATRGGAGGGSKQTPVSADEGNGTRVPLAPDGNRPVVGENGSGTPGSSGRTNAPTLGNERPAQGNRANENTGQPGGRGPGRDGTSIEGNSEPANIVPPAGKAEPSGPNGFGDSANRPAPGGNGGQRSEQSLAAGDHGFVQPGRNSPPAPGDRAGGKPGEGPVTDSAGKGGSNPPNGSGRTNPVRQDTKPSKNGSPAENEPDGPTPSPEGQRGESAGSPATETADVGKSSADPATADRFSSGGASRADAGRPSDHQSASEGDRGQNPETVRPSADPGAGNGGADRPDPSPEQVGQTGKEFAEAGGLSEHEAADWGAKFADAQRDGGRGAVAKVHEDLTNHLDNAAFQKALSRPGPRPDPEYSYEHNVQARNDALDKWMADRPDPSPEQIGQTGKEFAEAGGLSEHEAADWGAKFADAQRDGGRGAVAKVHEDLTNHLDNAAFQKALSRPGPRPDPEYSYEHNVQARNDALDKWMADRPDPSPEQIGQTGKEFAEAGGLSEHEAADWGAKFADAQRDGGRGAVAKVHEDLTNHLDNAAFQKALSRPGRGRPDPSDHIGEGDGPVSSGEPGGSQGPQRSDSGGSGGAVEYHEEFIDGHVVLVPVRTERGPAPTIDEPVSDAPKPSADPVAATDDPAAGTSHAPAPADHSEVGTTGSTSGTHSPESVASSEDGFSVSDGSESVISHDGGSSAGDGETLGSDDGRSSAGDGTESVFSSDGSLYESDGGETVSSHEGTSIPEETPPVTSSGAVAFGTLPHAADPQRGPGRDGTSVGGNSEPANIVPPAGKAEPSGPSGFGDSANRPAPGGNGGPRSEQSSAAGDHGFIEPGRNSPTPVGDRPGTNPGERADSTLKGGSNTPNNGARTNPARQDTKTTKNGSPVDGEPDGLDAGVNGGVSPSGPVSGPEAAESHASGSSSGTSTTVGPPEADGQTPSDNQPGGRPGSSGDQGRTDKPGPSRAEGSSGGPRTTPNPAQGGTSPSAQESRSGTGRAPEEPPRLNVSQDHQQVAAKTLEMIRAQFPDQLGDVVHEAGLIVWHLSHVPGANRFGDQDLVVVQRQVAADLVWGGHRAAVNSARGFLGLFGEDMPPFDPQVREIFGRSRFNVERAEISLGLSGRDEFVADAARILEGLAFEGAEVGRESREVLLVAAEIARGHRRSGSGHENGVRLAHRLIGQVRPNDPDSQVHGSADPQPGSSAQLDAATQDSESSFENALTRQVNARLRETGAVSRDQVLRVWELLKDERSEAALPKSVSGRADVVAQVVQLGEERSEEAFRGLGGAVGFEGETAVEVTKPDGTPLKAGTVLAVHLDGHKLVVDERYFVVDTDGGYHADERDLQAAGKEFERKEESSVAEAVSSPYGIHGEADRRTSDRPETVSHIDNALYKLYQGHGRTIGEVLDGEDGWRVNSDEAEDLINVLPLNVGYDIARGGVPVFPQESVGVALAGMYGFLTYLAGQFPPASPGMVWHAQVHLEAALAFGTDIAADFVAEQYETSISPYEVDLLDDVESVTALRGFMALVYTQVAAIIHHHPYGDDEFVKNFTAAVSRTSLGGILAIAPRDVRSYLEANAQTVRDQLVARYQKTMRTTYRMTAGPDVLQTPVEHGTVGDYLDNALLKRPRKRFNQTQAIDVHTAFDAADDNDGRLDPALIVLEARGAGAQLIGINDIGEKLDPIEARARSEYEHARRIRGRQVGPSELATLLETDQAKKVRKIWEGTKKLTEGDSGNSELLSLADIKNILQGLRAADAGRSPSAVSDAGRALAALAQRLGTVKVSGHSARATTRLRSWIQSSLNDIRDLESHLGVNTGPSGAHGHGPIMRAEVSGRESTGDDTDGRPAPEIVSDDASPLAPVAPEAPVSGDGVLRLRGGAGGDIIDDWKQESALSLRHPRSRLLGQIDARVKEWRQGRTVPGQPDWKEAQLDSILRAIDEWWRARHGRASQRDQAIHLLSEHVRAERDGVRIQRAQAQQNAQAARARADQQRAEAAWARAQQERAERAWRRAHAALRYDASPASWPQGLHVQQSASGDVGVYFVTDGADNGVVVKPMRAHGDEFYYADNFIRNVGQLTTPRARIYSANSPEGQVLSTLLGASSARMREYGGQLRHELNKAQHFLVMERVDGDTLENLAKYRDLQEMLADREAMASIGRLMVLDAFLGYRDRMISDYGGIQRPRPNINLSNIMYEPGQGITAIDNRFVPFAGNDGRNVLRAENLRFLKMFEDSRNVDELIGDFLDKLEETYRAERHLPAGEPLEDLTRELRHTRASIAEGIRAGLAEIGTRALEYEESLAQEQADNFPESPRHRWNIGGLASYAQWRYQNIPALDHNNLGHDAAVTQLRDYLDQAIHGPVHTGSGGTRHSPFSPLITEAPVQTPATAGTPTPARAEDVLTRLLAQAPAENRSHTWFDPASTRPVSSAFDVRRVEHEGERITELTVTVDLRPQAGVTADDVANAWQQVNHGVDEFFNEPQHRFTHGDVAGDLLRVKVVPVQPGRRAHLTVSLVAYAPGQLMSQHTWVIGQRPVFYAHEIAHQLGARDESRRPSREYRLGDTTRTITRTAQNAGSLLGDFTAATEGGLPRSGLRSRHLDLLATLIGHVPAYTRRDRVQAVVAAAQSLEGSLRWRGGTELDNQRWVIGEDTGWGFPDDFARWIHGTGGEPTEQSTMNCWEAVLFAAHRAGVVDKSWLQKIHRDAGNAATNVDATVDPLAIYPYEGYSANEAAFHAALMRGMVSGDLRRYEINRQTGIGTTDIPAGHLVFFGGLGGHVALSLGTRDAQNRQQVLSLWNQPNGISTGSNIGYTISWMETRKYGYMQVTSVEELMSEGLFMTGAVVEFAAPSWERSALTGVTAAGSGAPNTASPSRSTRPDAPTAGTRPAGAGRTRSAVTARSRRLPPAAPPPSAAPPSVPTSQPTRLGGRRNPTAPPTAPPPGALPPLPVAPEASPDDGSPLAPVAPEAPLHAEAYIDEPPGYVEPPDYAPESLPTYVDPSASPQRVAAVAAQLELDEEQAAALLRYSWFDRDRFAAVRDQVGEFDPADLAEWIGQIGRIPEDLPAIAEQLASMDVHDVYEVSREFGIDPRHLPLFAEDLNGIYSRSGEPGFDAPAEVRNVFATRYVPADQFADFVVGTVRAEITPDELQRVLRAQENRHLTPALLLQMEPDDLLDLVDSALRFHAGRTDQETVEEQANRILHQQMPGELTRSQSGKVSDAWFSDAVAQVQAILQRTDGGSDDRLRWATNRARRLVDLRQRGIDTRAAGLLPVAGSSTGPGTLAGERPEASDDDLQQVIDRLVPMEPDDVDWIVDYFGIDARDLQIFGHVLPDIYWPRQDGVDSPTAVQQLFDTYSPDIATFVSVAARAGINADEMRALVDSARHSEGLTLGDLQRMPTPRLSHLVLRELAPLREITARLAPMSLGEVTNVSRLFGIAPANFWIFGNALPAIFAQPRDGNDDPLAAVRDLFADYAENIAAFVTVAIRAGGLTADDLAAVLTSFDNSDYLPLEDLLEMAPDDLQEEVSGELAPLREAAAQLAPLTALDVAEVSGELGVEVPQLWVFGHQLRTIYSQAEMAGFNAAVEAREQISDFVQDLPHVAGQIPSFASLASTAGLTADGLRAVLDSLDQPSVHQLPSMFDDLVLFARDRFAQLQAADRLAPMSVNDVAAVTGAFTIGPDHLEPFGDQLRAIYSRAHTEGADPWAGVQELFARYAYHERLDAFATVATRVGITAADMRLFLELFRRDAWWTFDDLLAMPDDELVDFVQEPLASLEGAAEQLSPMSMSDLAGVSGEFRIGPGHLWIFGEELSGIYSRARTSGSYPLAEVRQMLSRYADLDDLPTFASVASAAGITADAMRSLADRARRESQLTLADLQRIDPAQISILASPVADGDIPRNKRSAPDDETVEEEFTGRPDKRRRVDDEPEPSSSQAGPSTSGQGSSTPAEPIVLPAYYAERIERARELLEDLPEDVQEHLLVQAGQINGVYHRPLPMDVTTVSNGQRAVHEGIALLVAERLYRDRGSDRPLEGARALSEALAEDLGTRLRTGAAPVGSSRPPVDLYEIGGGGESSGTTADAPSPGQEQQDGPTRAELYARRLRQALDQDPVDHGEVIRVLQLVGRDAGRVSALEESFASLGDADGPRTLATALGQAVEDDRLTEAQYEGFLRLLGHAHDFFATPVEVPRTALSPAEARARNAAPETVPEVRAFAERLIQLIDNRHGDDALTLLRQLDRNERALWLVSGAYSNLTGRWLFDDLAVRAEADMTANADVTVYVAHSVHLDDANDYYRRLADSTFDHHTDHQVPVPAGHPEDGCYLRAHLWVLQLRQWGVEARKVFVQAATGQSLVTSSGNAFGATSSTPRPIRWGYHVAPVIRVDRGDGVTEDVVLDPALEFGEAVSIQQWLIITGVVGDYTSQEIDASEPSSTEGTEGTDAAEPGPAAVHSQPHVVLAPPNSYMRAGVVTTAISLRDYDVLSRQSEDKLRDYSSEVALRRAFRDWHAGLLEAGMRDQFDDLYGGLDRAGMRDFHDWFRAEDADGRQDFLSWFENRSRMSVEPAEPEPMKIDDSSAGFGDVADMQEPLFDSGGLDFGALDLGMFDLDDPAQDEAGPMSADAMSGDSDYFSFIPAGDAVMAPPPGPIEPLDAHMDHESELYDAHMGQNESEPNDVADTQMGQHSELDTIVDVTDVEMAPHSSAGEQGPDAAGSAAAESAIDTVFVHVDMDDDTANAEGTSDYFRFGTSDLTGFAFTFTMSGATGTSAVNGARSPAVQASPEAIAETRWRTGMKRPAQDELTGPPGKRRRVDERPVGRPGKRRQVDEEAGGSSVQAGPGESDEGPASFEVPEPLVRAGYGERFIRAARALRDLPAQMRDSLVVQAGQVNGFHHEPLPWGMDAVSAEQRAVHEGVTLLVTEQLYLDYHSEEPLQGAHALSAALAGALDTRLRRGGAPVGSSRPPVDLYLIGGDGGPSRTTTDTTEPDQTQDQQSHADTGVDDADSDTAQVSRAALYARRLQAALSAAQVDSAEVNAVLQLVGRDADPVRDLEDAFASLVDEDGHPTTLASAMGQAVEDERLSEEQYEGFLRLLGYADVFFQKPIANFRTAIPPDEVIAGTTMPERLPEVRAFTERLIETIEREHGDAALELVRQLDGDERALWLLAAAYANLTGRRLLGDLQAVVEPETDLALGPHAYSVHADDANDYYRRLAASTFDHHADGEIPVPAGHPEDGCTFRAHLWVLQLRQWGVDARKVYAVAARGESLVTSSTNAFGATSSAPRQVTWDFHVAPLIRLDPGDGRPAVDMVLDPALQFGEAVTVERWLEAIGVHGDYSLQDLSAGSGAGQTVDRSRPRVIFGPANAAWTSFSEVTTASSLHIVDTHARLAEDQLRDHQSEVNLRREFRDWHSGLEPRLQREFDTMYGAFGDSAVEAFQNGFRAQSAEDRHDYTARLEEHFRARLDRQDQELSGDDANAETATPDHTDVTWVASGALHLVRKPKVRHRVSSLGLDWPGQWRELEPGDAPPRDAMPWSEWHVLPKARRDQENVYVRTEDLSQRDLFQLMYVILRDDDDPDLAWKVQQYSVRIDREERENPQSRDRLIWTGDEIVSYGHRLQERLDRLTHAIEAGHTGEEIRSLTTELVDAADWVDAALVGFGRGTAHLGGVYGLRNRFAPLTSASRNLAAAVDRSGPEGLTREDGTRPVSPETLRGLAAVVRRYRRRAAYDRILSGEYWQTDRPEIEDLSHEERVSFIEHLSRENLRNLRSATADLLANPDYQRLYDKLVSLPLRMKHGTSAYHAITRSGTLSSLVDLELRGEGVHASSGGSQPEYIDALGTHDFVSLRVQTGDGPMETRFGSTVISLELAEIARMGGWVSLHDQLEPLAPDIMRDLTYNGQTIRRANEEDDVSWTVTYRPGQSDEAVRKVNFREEVFYGDDAVEGLALASLREISLIGGDFQREIMETQDPARIWYLISRFFRPEAKLPSGPLAGDGVGRLHVVNPDGAGLYRPDGTINVPPRTPEAKNAEIDPPVEDHAADGDADPLDVLGRAQPLSAILPEELWWRLYLDPRDHVKARRALPANPGFLYDTEESPGFQQSMVDAYRMILDVPAVTRLSSAEYKRMHEIVTAHLNEQFDWSGKQSEGFAPPTEFPLRGSEPHPEVLTEMVGDRPLLVRPVEYMERETDGSKPDPIAIVNGFQLSNVIIQTVYAQSEVPGLVDAVLDRYYEEIAEAHTAHDRLRAIGRVVRNLHIIHPFGDANRRLNVHVLLPKLLLEQGFQPVVRPDMAMLFQGGFSTDQIADALLEGQQDDLSAETEVSPAEEWVTIRDWVLGVLGEAGPDPGTPMLQLAEALREFDDVLTREFEDDAAYDQAYSDAMDQIAMAANALTEPAEAGPAPAASAERGVTTVIDAAMRLVGGLRWRGASSPEASSGWSIGETTRWGHPNHFGRWIRDTGPEPNEWSTMNCWEAVLFAAYQAGAVSKAWLRRIHAEAADAAVAAVAVATTENPGGNLGGRHLATDAYGQLALLGEVTYDAELMKRFYQGELSEYEVTAVERPAIPAGHWIFFNGTNHVGMSLGTRDEQGRQRMLSLWTFPAHIPAGPTDQAYTYGNLQVTTVEELIESGDLAGQKVEHATPVWEPSPASGAAEGSRQASGDGGRDDSAHLPDRGPDAGREDAGQGARGLSRAGRTLLGGLNGAANDTAQSRPMLGRDFFGLHTAPTRPSFMVDVDDVSTDRLPSLFRALDLTHPDAPTQQELQNLQPSPDEVWIDDRSYQARLDDLLAQGRFNVEDYDSSVVMDHLAETPRAEMPKVLHEMWVGSVFDPTDESNRQHADNLARLAAEARSHNWMMVLWTDQPRHLFQSADVSPEIERMRDWARENGIVLLNDDELLSGQDVDPLDAQLEPFAQMENAKLTRLGSVARSDIKRLRAVYAFGGYYNDLDNEFITFDGLEDIFSGPGFGVHHDGAGYGNSGFFATRRHIAIREFKRQQAMNYSISERALYWNDAKLRDTRNIYSLTSRSGNELIVTSGVSRARRYSVIKRTGPDIIRHVSSALEYDDGYLPRVSQFTMGSANSWMPRQGSPLRAPRTYAAQDVGWVLQRVISTLVRGLYDRDGDLHLTAVAPVINGLPDPAAAWEAVLAFILERDSLADRIRTITDQVLYYTDRYETDRVDLPSSIAGRLYIEYGNGEWLLGERFRRAVVRRDRTRELPAPPTVPTATGTRPVQADGEDTSADSSVPPVRPPGDLGTAPEPPAVPAEEPAPAQRATDLVTLLRDGGLTRIADYLEAGKVPQIQLTEGVQRRLISPANADDPLSRAVDALIASPEVQVLDAEGHLVSPATDTDDTASSAASGRAEERFLIRASGNVSGPFELAAAEGDTWQKSSWSRPEEPGGPVHCVEVTVIETASLTEC